ncbi:MAG TPA: LysM domain-containing protein [Candidatus Binatia bacterium]|nr:LysM domain-containing protein [Candidatus Binatia bacterium]
MLPAVCPFLAGETGPAAVHDVRLCLAGERPIDLARLQVELVCRTERQADCPRFVAAVRRGRRPPAPEAILERSPGAGQGSAPVRLTAIAVGSALAGLPRARAAALAVLAVAVFVAAAGTLRPGGLTVAGLLASPTPTATSAPSPAATPTVPPPSPTPAPSPSVPPSSEPSPSPTPSPSPSPSPSSSVPPSPEASPSPTSDRYALLKPCPDRPACYIYTVRQGDNLWSIGNYFGVPLATIYELNPWARTTGLRAGQELVLPPPTR